MKNNPIYLLLITVLCSATLIAQDQAPATPEAVIHPVYSPFSFSESAVLAARSVADLHRQYPADWIAQYVEVTLHTQRAGKRYRTRAEGPMLTVAQRQALADADPAAPILVSIEYLPNNQLRENPVRCLEYTVTVTPDTPPHFGTTTDAEASYLTARILEDWAPSVFAPHQLAAVRFTVDDRGAVQDPVLLQSTKDPAADAAFLAAIGDMPAWTPATYRDGSPAASVRVLSVGDLRSCTANLVGLPPWEE